MRGREAVGGGDRCIASTQGHDFALADFSERLGSTPDKTGIALVLHERGTALGLPAAGFEVEEYLKRGCDVCGRTRHIETDGAVLGEAMALAAQLLQFLGSPPATPHSLRHPPPTPP